MTDDASLENLRKFLESDDCAMVQMGLSMAKGSWVPELLPTILGLSMWDDDKTVRAAAKSVFNKYAPAEIQAKVKENWKPSYRTLPISGNRFPEIIRRLLELFNSQDDFAKIALLPLIKTLSDDEQGVRKSAARALEKIGKPVVEHLIGVLSDDYWWVRWHAARVLDKLGWVPETDEQRAAYLIASMDWESLVEWGAPAVEPLIKTLSDENEKVYWAAARALRKFGAQGLQGFITAGKAEQLSVPELKTILKEKKLPTSGTKALLIQRIVDAK